VRLVHMQGRLEQATQLLSAVESLRSSVEMCAIPIECAITERHVVSLRNHYAYFTSGSAAPLKRNTRTVLAQRSAPKHSTPRFAAVPSTWR
jgi:hypothetical protein